MPTFCGLDFGTSNSTIGIAVNNACQLVALENNKATLRSAIFCNAEVKKFQFGQEGIDSYLEGDGGRLMMALKSVLGSSLIEDKTVIFGEYIPYTQVLSHFIKYIKTKAEQNLEEELTQVVMGRPVHFHDHDINKDNLAQNTLEQVAREAGFKEVLFQYEPIAAALTYETTITKEQLALIVDMGGGTSDFSIIRLTPNAKKIERKQDVLANTGIHIAGTDFDKKLSMHSVMPLLGMGSFMKSMSGTIELPSMYYHDLTTWHTLSTLYDKKTITHVQSIYTQAFEKEKLARLLSVLEQRAGHHILDSVEKCKQRLSDNPETNLDLNFIEEGLSLIIDDATLNTEIAELLANILQTIHATVKIANVNTADITAIFYTGGSTKIPIIRKEINAIFPQAAVIQGDAFGSVGLGLTLDAQRKFSP